MIKAQKQQRRKHGNRSCESHVVVASSLFTGSVCVPAPPGVFLPELDHVSRFN